MLPSAADSSESIIVLLDWYSGHLTEEVEEVVRRKGHVLLFHGCGCTPVTHVSDTHLQATLARYLIQIENESAPYERQRLLDLGENKTPKLHRDTIISVVQNAWLCFDHVNVAKKGYMQTGSAMPLSGPVSPDDVFRDLCNAMVSGMPTEVGMTLRDEAVAFVNRRGHLLRNLLQWSMLSRSLSQPSKIRGYVNRSLLWNIPLPNCALKGRQSLLMMASRNQMQRRWS
jgi:hypothetical protein